MTNQNIVCIGCPMGCQLTVEMKEQGNISVTGHTCRRGEVYAKKEMTNPTRIVTTTVRVCNSLEKVISVKTEKDIPKDKIFECIDVLKNVSVQAPVCIGDIIIENIAETGVNIIATKAVEE
ncbi:MAG: DUF1667 domain-containing protein [Eubacteriales bacterium]